MNNSCVGYSRVSGPSQLLGDGFPRQDEAIAACAASLGLTVLRYFHEEAVPGKLGEDDRPAFQEMIAALLGNGCRTIIVESLDRFAREYDRQQQLATYIASKGLTLISANTGEDITAALMGDPMRRALVQIQGIFAELDKNLTIAKLRKARDRKKSTTGRCEGVKPFGSLDGEADTLAYILNMRRMKFHPDAIAVLLNSEGYTTRSAKPWHPSTIRKILARANKENHNAIQSTPNHLPNLHADLPAANL